MKINLKINSSKFWLNKFPWKKKNDHKYSRGKLVIFGSQPNMIGSTILSSEAALRVGTVSVKIACSKKTLPIYSLKFPSVLKEEVNNIYILTSLYLACSSLPAFHSTRTPRCWWNWKVESESPGSLPKRANRHPGLCNQQTYRRALVRCNRLIFRAR